MSNRNEPTTYKLPAETQELIEHLAGAIGSSNEETISKGIRLLQLWILARDEHREWLERDPKKPEVGKETFIEVASEKPRPVQKAPRPSFMQYRAVGIRVIKTATAINRVFQIR